MSHVLLSLQNVSKSYATKVVDSICLDVHVGEIHALLGANGAGKSTVCRVIAGLTPLTSGSMRLLDQDYRPSGKQEAERRGVQIVQQELCLIPTLTVAENLMLSRLPHVLGCIRTSRLRQQARKALDRVGLANLDHNRLVGTLGVGQQQLIEIAAALDRDCQLLILDEPTSSLSLKESEELFAWLKKLRSQGIGIVYVSHRLDEVNRLADRVTILRDGKHVCTRTAGSFTVRGLVAEMTGQAAQDSDLNNFRSFRTPQVALRVDGLSRGSTVQGVSFQLQRGERLGIAGLVGAGRTELLRLIFGADRADSGALFLYDQNQPVRFRHPKMAVNAGLAMVTEDRKNDGLLLPWSVRCNVSLAALATKFSRAGWIRRQHEQSEVTQVRASLDIKCNHLEQPVGTLSGGNQQKVVVAKWLLQGAEILLFDEPTRGVDVEARHRIYQLMESLSREGKAMVIVSSDLDELFHTCDRIAVMSAGKLVTTFERADWSVEKIMEAAFSEHLDRPV
jgi:ribose transport system ATP-binding protein